VTKVVQWNSIPVEEWPTLQPYVDTALLPVVRMAETDWAETLSRCAHLAKCADRVEQHLAGRLVRFPLLTLYGSASPDEAVAALKATFAHVVVLTDGEPFAVPGGVVLSTHEREGDPVAALVEEIVALWNGPERQKPDTA